jgi:hypothetical protein
MVLTVFNMVLSGFWSFLGFWEKCLIGIECMVMRFVGFDGFCVFFDGFCVFFVCFWSFLVMG